MTAGEGKSETESGCGYFVKLAVFVFNLFFVLCGLALLGVGIWISVDRNFLSSLLRAELYASASYLCIGAGIIIIVIAFFGCCGARTENKCLVVVFLIFLIILFLILVVAGIVAVVFRDKMGDTMKSGMKRTLVDWYGDDHSQMVTDAWDLAQSRLFCCAVDKEGWGLYNQTKWVKDANPGLNRISPGYQYVPASCCKRDYRGNYVDLNQCQSSRYMPPGTSDGGFNDAVFYEGCYEQGYNFLVKHAAILLGLGFGVAFTLLLGIIFSVILLKYI